MPTYDLIVVLGGKIGVNSEGVMVLGPHTEKRARAAGIAWQQTLTDCFILSGGYCVGVRYDLNVYLPSFGSLDSNAPRRANFSAEALKASRLYRSEASLMSEFLQKNYNVEPEALILEEASRTTAENAQFCVPIIQRLSARKVGLITDTAADPNHMQRALAEFQKLGLTLMPIFAESLLI